MFTKQHLFAVSALLGGLLVSAAPALAQDQVPVVKQEFGKQEEVKEVIWKASASAGFSISTGNASVMTLSGGANASRNDGTNKIALGIKGIYGVTDIVVFTDANGNKVADDESELTVDRKRTAALLLGTFRYDRFFSKNNTGYLMASAGLDLPASKQFMGGGQIGYSRQLVNTKMHLLSAELGYDFNYTKYIVPDVPPANFAENVFLHSARIFAGYVLSVADHTSVEANVEALVNFNTAHIGDRDVGAGSATRVNGQLAFTTKVWKALSLRAATMLRYNNAPGLTTAFAYDPNFAGRYNQKLDTLTELQLVVNFL
ncbi:MAG TPA: DUF481 domain-containing protein [Pseudomonadota bacterium]|nr:DUF481 domain-containing protein [Pseudomonadota bacterium]HND09946.1 DUF481 domain-containing protein [Pseudomonadota bacterium]HNF97306.1 DUF481 domain-containing protein [Pseudomonadota bacterium]HNI59317.1 DUF481 domain-containing protein [Pseudomonadota bacterium]HNN50112.1 DUF481 domain-containing protein [Pseudomonadota bacterium]